MSQRELLKGLKQDVLDCLDQGNIGKAVKISYEYKKQCWTYFRELEKGLEIFYDKKSCSFQVRASAPIDLLPLSVISDKTWRLDSEGVLGVGEDGKETIQTLLDLGVIRLEPKLKKALKIASGVC